MNKKLCFYISQSSSDASISVSALLVLEVFISWRRIVICSKELRAAVTVVR